MKKFYVLGVPLFVVCAFGVFSVASASAAVTFLLAEILDNGLPLVGSVPADGESSEILLEETILGVKIDILCSGIFDGTANINGEGTVTELLTLSGTLVSKTPLEEPGLACTNSANCPEPLIWADNLPWKLVAELMVDGTETFFVGLLLSSGAGNPGYHIACMGNSLSDLCEINPGISKLTNTAEGLDGESSEVFTELAEGKLGNCITAGNEKGIVEGLGFLLFTEATLGPITVSSE
jgi:hypothetical protein